MTAESAYRNDRRIPLWLSFSVILVNDNAPKLAGSNVLEIVVRGERILHPSLLNWVDGDIDAAPLNFDFQQVLKVGKEDRTRGESKRHNWLTD